MFIFSKSVHLPFYIKRNTFLNPRIIIEFYLKFDHSSVISNRAHLVSLVACLMINYQRHSGVSINCRSDDWFMIAVCDYENRNCRRNQIGKVFHKRRPIPYENSNCGCSLDNLYGYIALIEGLINICTPAVVHNFTVLGSSWFFPQFFFSRKFN